MFKLSWRKKYIYFQYFHCRTLSYRHVGTVRVKLYGVSNYPISNYQRSTVQYVNFACALFVCFNVELVIDMENWTLDRADDVVIHLFKIVNCDYFLRQSHISRPQQRQCFVVLSLSTSDWNWPITWAPVHNNH